MSKRPKHKPSKSLNSKSSNNKNSKKNEDEDRILRKLFVDKLTNDITEKDIEEAFSRHGPIEEVAKYQDRGESGRYFAFVIYKKAADCLKATREIKPVVKGQEVVCMLAAIGKSYSGYEFFVKKGFLTDEASKKDQYRKSKKSNKKMKPKYNQKKNIKDDFNKTQDENFCNQHRNSKKFEIKKVIDIIITIIKILQI